MGLFAWHNLIEALSSSARCYFLSTVMQVVCLQHNYATSMFVFVFTTRLWCLYVCVCLQHDYGASMFVCVYNTTMVPLCLCVFATRLCYLNVCVCVYNMTMVPQCLCVFTTRLWYLNVCVCLQHDYGASMFVFVFTTNGYGTSMFVLVTAEVFEAAHAPTCLYRTMNISSRSMTRRPVVLSIFSPRYGYNFTSSV